MEKEMGNKKKNKLNYEFIDTDQFIQEQEQKTIAEIFETSGEAHFRELERLCVHSLQEKERLVLSTGGGLPCFNDNMQALLAFGTCIYLKRDVNDLVNRILNSKTERPLAVGKSSEELMRFVKDQLEIREEFYAKAHFTADRKIQNHNQLIRFLANQGLDLLPG